jgi:hypothetical protein
MTHIVLTVAVCGGLVLLLPVPPSSHGLPAAISPVVDCSAPLDASGGPQLAADDAELSAPDSDDDDDDDDAPSGSDVAIAAEPAQAISHGDVIHVVHVEAESWISRTVDGHSLRGPPADDQTSSDADDIDGDDDDPTAEYSALVPPVITRRACVLTPAVFVSVSSIRSSSLALRAPPL